MPSSKRSCTLKILDEVNCVFVGLHPDHVGYLYEDFAVFAPNYFFNPKYKLGSWDGKIRFFHKTGTTHVNLLEEIVPKVVALGYNIKIIDQRADRSVHPTPVDEDYFSDTLTREGEPWKMRDYQIEMVNILMEEGGGVGVAGTGAGKTSMCAAIAIAYERAAKYRSIIIVPDKNLTSQTRREYEYFNVDAGEYSGTCKDVDHQHVVSTWQALQNNPAIIQQFQVVIVDECHGLKGQVLTKILNEYGKNIVHRFGVTGTLPKEETDRMAVTIAVGRKHYEIPAWKLIEQGYLANAHIDVMQLEVNYKKEYADFCEHQAPTEKKLTYIQFKDQYLPDWVSEKRFLQSENERLEWIASYIALRGDEKKGNVLCLVNGVAFGKRLVKLIPDAVFVHGKDDMKVREEIYGLFATNENIIVLATIHIASTGLDIPRIFNLMFIDAGKSFIRVIQSIGRGLRKAKDKDSVLITDIASDLKYSKKHLAERIKYYKEAKYPYKKRKVDYYY